MSQRGQKAAGQSRKDGSEKGANGKKSRPAELPEITHDCYRDWDDIIQSLKEYFRENYQDLQSICQDPMKLTQAPAYVTYSQPPVAEEELRAITPENDPTGVKKMLFMGHWNGENTAFLKLRDKQKVDRISAYQVIRTMCSPQLNSLLVADTTFMESSESDPLELLNIIKRLVTTRPDGNEELDRQKALGEWLTLRMGPSEDILTYGRRAVKLFERLTQTGIPAEEQPKPAQQSMRFIDGLDSSVQIYHNYKMYLVHSKQQTGRDIYPTTLVDAIKNASRFATASGDSLTVTPAFAPHTVLGAQELPKTSGKEKSDKHPRQSKVQKGKNTKDQRTKYNPEAKKKSLKFDGECHKCGKVGHRAIDCYSKQTVDGKPISEGTPTRPRVSFAASHTEPTSLTSHGSMYTNFGPMYDEEGDLDGKSVNYVHRCNMIRENHRNLMPTLGPKTGITETGVTNTLGSKNSIQPNCTEVIFDTGATGSIITCKDLLTTIVACSPLIFKGLNGSLTVSNAGKLKDIGIVYFDPRGQTSIISASECLRQGHVWEFRYGNATQLDAFLLHTKLHTYKFQSRGGLYVADLAVPPEPRYQNALEPRSPSAYQTIGPHQDFLDIDTWKLPTVTRNESFYSKREVKRSIAARNLQASLGFPPDAKLISALRAGGFLNCDVLPEDVTRATAIWGLNVAALKGRTTHHKPPPPPQQPVSRRRFDDQHMHCDIMFVNKQPFLVSITQPLGIVLVDCVEDLTTPTLRRSIRQMFGTIGSRRITIVRFTSDNERGLAALVGDMNAMKVEVITVGPGDHDHIIERLIRHLKETIRATIFSLPYLVADTLMSYLVLSCAKKLLLFPSSTRTDMISPFEAFFGRKADLKLDIGPPFGTYCQVANRTMSNSMDPRTLGCIYLEARMNGTNTHSFMRIDTHKIIGAGKFESLPIPPTAIHAINVWAAKNKLHLSKEPRFTFHDRDITDDAADDGVSAIVPLTLPKLAPLREPDPILPVLDPVTFPPALLEESPIAPEPSEIRGDTDVEIVTENPSPTPEENLESTEPVEAIPDLILDTTDEVPLNVRTYQPTRHVEPREKSTRIRKPVDRLNLGAVEVPQETLESVKSHNWATMTVTRALKLFPEKTEKAIETEVKSLLAKNTFVGVHIHTLTPTQRKKILRSNMNVVEKYLPSLDLTGKREIDKVKARFCVDGRAQAREDYEREEIESPTANISSIFTIAQIAAAENRFVMVGDVGTAYLNARMPMDIPDKILHMLIEGNVAAAIIKQDPTFAQFRRPNGGILVRLEKALYGCIESAKLWYTEIAKTLTNNGFQANPRDLCVFNKQIKGNQFTIVVYVDDLKMTCVDKAAVLAMEQTLVKTYGQFRTCTDRIVAYLGCMWDYTEPGFVKVSQSGMIQDLVTAREEYHTERGLKLNGKPNSPAAPHLFDRTVDCDLLSDVQAKIFHTHTATAIYLCTHSRPDIVLTVGELCKRVKAPTTEDDKKLDRLICYLRETRDKKLRLQCCMPPRVTVSIDAAFANRDMMKSTSGMCVTLGVGNFITSSKVQKLNSKSSTEAEIIAVSDGMNIPLWLGDFISHQGHGSHPIRLEQDNQSCITLLKKGRSTAETTRFIEIRKFWISDYIRIKMIDLVYVPTEDMTSDYFTKPVQGAVFAKLVKKIMGN